MYDVMYAAGTLVFFGLMLLFVAACGKLGGYASDAKEQP